MGFRIALLQGAALVFAAVAVATPGGAQEARGTITGLIITGDARRPVVDAAISLPTIGRHLVTDTAGRFRVANVPRGTYRIEARAIGFQPVWQTVAVGGDSVVMELVLKPAVVALPEVLVSTSREEQLASTTPMSVGVVNGEAIREARGRHPSEIVNRVPGVYVSNFGGEGHATAIRQPITTKALYAYLEDGVPIRSTGFFNHNALYEINLPQAGRIEVIRGPGSAVYGSDAVGGVVNSFTQDPASRPEASLFVEGGSATYFRALGTMSTTARQHGFRADVNVTSAHGWRRETPYERQSGTLRWDYHLNDRSRVKTVASVSHIDQPGDGGSDLLEDDYRTVPELTYTPIAYRRVFAARLSSELQVRSELSLAAATLYARYNDLDLLPSWQLSFDPQIWESRHRSIGVLTRWRRTLPSLNTNVSAGVDAEYSPGSRLETRIVAPRTGRTFMSYSTAEVQYDYDVAFWQGAPYVQADVALPARLGLSLGLRYDHLGYEYDNHLTELTSGTHRRPASTSVTFNRLSPKLGATWEMTPSAMVFASYRAAFRAPSESQLFRQGSAERTIDLKPVRAESWEAGARAGIGGIATVEVTAYSMRLRDDILTFFNPSDSLRFTQNAGATNHRGIETGVSLAVTKRVQVDAAASYAKHTYVAWQPNPTTDYSGKEMELAPRLLANARVTYRPAFLASGFMSVEWTKTGSYWMDPANTSPYKYGGHDLFNLQATMPVTADFELTGRVTNLGDRRFAETSSYNAQQGERFRPGAPRQFYLGAQYRFR